MEEKAIPIFWEENQELETTYINQMFISHGGGEFYIVFGEIAAPARNENMELPEKAMVNQKFRMVLTPENMERFIEVISSNYDKFLEKKNK